MFTICQILLFKMLSRLYILTVESDFNKLFYCHQIWTGPGATPKEANTLPELVSHGSATRIDFKEPFTLTGTVDFF